MVTPGQRHYDNQVLVAGFQYNCYLRLTARAGNTASFVETWLAVSDPWPLPSTHQPDGELCFHQLWIGMIKRYYLAKSPGLESTNSQSAVMFGWLNIHYTSSQANADFAGLQ